MNAPLRGGLDQAHPPAVDKTLSRLLRSEGKRVLSSTIKVNLQECDTHLPCRCRPALQFRMRPGPSREAHARSLPSISQLALDPCIDRRASPSRSLPAAAPTSSPAQTARLTR